MTNINLRSRAEGLARLARIRAELEAVSEAMANLERFPTEDPYENGAVLRFDKSWDGGVNVYSYVFIKCGSWWYSSGPRRPDPMNWNLLVSFMSSGVIGGIWEVATYATAFPEKAS